MKASLVKNLVLLLSFAIPAGFWFLIEIAGLVSDFRMENMNKVDAGPSPLWGFSVEALIVGLICVAIAKGVFALVEKLRGAPS